MESLGSDLQMEMSEKEKMLENLKLMVRDKDEIIRKKDSELQEAKASLSKFKLQSKAKITKLNHQLEEAKKASIPDNASDKSSECGEELPTEQANRAKMKLLRRKIEDKDRLLAEKDEQLAGRDQQMAAKENVIEERNQVIQQREEMIRTITNQLHERDKIINDMGQSGEQVPKIDQIYAQILYKDKLIVDLNNKILELDRKIIDLQEFAGEKNEVVKGRDKVITVLQTSIVEKDQNVTSQAALIKKLTSKVEASEENMSLLTEKLEKAEHNLKVESERFHLRLNETQKYFEETLGERESEISQLRDIIREREKDVATRDSNLRDLLIHHEQDLQEIMSRGEGSMQDHVVKILEQKLRDINGVLDSKVQVIEVLTSEVADKERQLLDTGNTVKALKEKLAISSEQNLLQQQTFADLEMQWKEERSKLEIRLRALAEKLEEERGELNLQLHTLQMSLRQYEAAYSQAAVQYNALQERYQQTYLEVQALKSVQSAAATSADQSLPSTDHSDLLKQLESETAQRKKLEEQVGVQEKEISKLQKVQMSESFLEKTASGEKVRGSKQRQSPEKSVASTKGESKAGDKQKSASDSPGSKASEAKLLKVKAQYTAKIKALEKEIEALKKSGGGPVSPDVETLQNRLAEVEEEKGNLMLHLVDFDDTRALQGQLEKQLSDMQKQNQSLQDETRHLHQQLEEAHLETSHLLERISQMQQADEHIRAQYANEKAELLANEEAQKMQMKLQLDQLQEECNRLTNQLQEDAKQQDSLHKQLQSTESCIGELRAQVQASNAAVEELQKNLVERSEQTSKLAGEKVGLEVRAAELEEIRDKLEQEKSELLTKVESLQTRIEFEKQPNLAFEKESQHLQSKIQELTEEISKEKGLSKVHKDQINELLPKLQQLENEKWQMEAERNQLGDQLMALSKAKEETDTLLQETNLVLESLRTDKQQGEESVNKILQETVEEKKELQKKLADTCSTMEQQTQEIGHICKALELEGISVQQLSIAVQNRISSIATLQTKLEKAEKELAEAQEVNAKREADIESLKSQVKNYQKQIGTSMQSMAEECDTYKENLLTKDQTIELLQETVEAQNNEMQKFHELQKARDRILTSLELKMEEYESNTLEKDKEHNAVVQSLQNEVETLQNKLDINTQEISEMESKQTLLSKDLESKDVELQNLKMQLLAKMDNEREATKQLDSSQHEMIVQGLVEERDQKILSLHQELDSINTLLEERQALEAKTRSQLTGLQENLLMKDAELFNVSDQLEKARQFQTGVEDELKTLREQLLSKETAHAALQASMAEQQQKVSDLSENFKFALHEKETLHVEMVNVQNELTLVTNTNLGLTKELTNAKQALSDREQAFNELLSNLEAEKNNSRAELENRDSKIRELEKCYAESRSELSELSARVEELESSVRESKIKSQEFLQEKNETKSQIERFSELLVQKETEKQHLEEANSLLIDERNGLQEQLALTCQTVSDRDATIKELTMTNNSIGEELKNSLTRLETVTEEKNQWEEKAVDNLRKISDLEEDILKQKTESGERELQVTEELHRHSEQLVASNSNTQRLQIETETLNNELKLERTSHTAKTAELSKLQDSLKESKEKQEELVKEIELLRLEKHECDLDLNNFKVTLQEKEDLIQNLMLALDESKGLKEKIDEEQVAILQEKESFLETVMCENKELKQEREELTVKIEALADEKSLMMKELDGFKMMESEKTALASKLEKAASEKETLRSKLKEAVAKIQSLGSKLKKAVSEKSDLDTKLEENITETKTLYIQLQEAVSQKGVLSTELEEVSLEKEALGTKLEVLLPEKDSLIDKLKEAESEKNALNMKINEQASESEFLSSKIASENEHLKGLLTSSESSLVKIREEQEELLKEFSTAKSELLSLEEEKNKLGGLKIQLDAALEENDALQVENKNLRSSLEQSLHEKDIVADELAQVDMKLVATLQDKTKTRNHLDQLMREHNKCADMEPRLEKALRDKRLLAEELSEVDGKLVQILSDKDSLLKQLVETEHKLEEAVFEKQEVCVLNEQLSKDLADQQASYNQMKMEFEKEKTNVTLMEDMSVQKETSETLQMNPAPKVAEVSHDSLENKESETSADNEHLTKNMNEHTMSEPEKSELFTKAVEFEEKLLQAETEISRLTKLYSEQACESEQLLQSKMAEVERLTETLTEKSKETSEAQSRVNELTHREQSLEKEIQLLSSITNAHTKAFEDLGEFLMKKLDPLLAVLVSDGGGDSGGGDLSCVNGVVPSEATTQVDAENCHKALTGTDLVSAHLDSLKTQVSEKFAKIEHWQSKVVENGKNDRSSLEKSLQELEQSKKQQESQSKLVKKLAQSLKKVKSDLSKKDKAFEYTDQQQKELETSLMKERSKIKQAEDDLHNFLLSSFSSDAKFSPGGELDESCTHEIELLSIIEDLKSKVIVTIKEKDGRVSDLNSLLQTQKEQVASLEEIISIANSTANSKVELSEELQEKYSECSRQLEEMQTKMAELTEEFATAQSENYQLMQVTKKLKESRVQKMAEVEELKQQLVDMNLENQSLSEKFQSVTKGLEEKVITETSAKANVEEQMSKLKEEFNQNHMELVSLKEFCETLKADDEKMVKKLTEEITTHLAENKELNNSFEKSKESCLLLEKELSERNSEVTLLKNSVKENEICVAKLQMDAEAKELKISSLNEATQIMKLELEKSYEEMQKCSDSNTADKENDKALQRFTDLTNSIFSSLNDIQVDIQKVIANSKSRKKPSITEELKDIINKSDDLESSLITTVNPPTYNIEDDMQLLEEGQPESALVFIKWLRGYLSNLRSVQEKEYSNAQNIVFELNAVVTSKEETNQDLMDKIDNLMVERKMMSERIASLKNICDDQKSNIKTSSSEVQKMKRSMEAASYEIFELLTSVKKANSSSLSTILEEEESEDVEEEPEANQEDYDAPDATRSQSEESIPNQLYALQSLARQVTLLIGAFSRTDGLCSAQDKEIWELRERLKAFEDQQQEIEQKTKKFLSVGDKQVNDSTKVSELDKQMPHEGLDRIDASQEEVVVQEEKNVTCQSQQTEILQAELDTTLKELFEVKQEREEMIENLALSQKHTEDLQKRLILENEKTITTETELQDVQNQLTTVQAKLETANNALNQLQTNSSGQEDEVSLLKTQLDKREEQLQNLSSELADLLKTGDEQQVKLAKKDEKMMSLLENMQELEEQLTSLGNQREADIAKLTAELTEKTASLEEAEKSLQTKETQYLKVLATAKKLKQQGEAAKKEASQALNQLKEFKDKVLAESSTSALDQAAVQLQSQDSAEKKEVTTDDMDNKSSERLQELTMQVESFSEYCQQLQLQVQALTEKLHTAEQLVNTKQMQLEALQSVSDEKESLTTSQNELLEGFEAKLASLQDEKETLANVVVGKEEMIQSIRNRVEELDKKIKALETETEKDARIRLLNEQLDETGKTMHSLQEEISLREKKLQESKNSELRAKDEHQKVIEQMTEQLKKAEEVGKAKQEISEQLASQMFDLSEQLQAKSVRVEELSGLLQSSDEKIKLLEVQLAEGESSLDEFKQQLQTVRDENGELVEELKSLKDLYNVNQEQLITQQKDLESKEQELLKVQKELDSLKDSLPKEELLQEYKQQLENQKTIETVPETSAQLNPNVSGQTSASYEKTLDQTIIEFPEPDFSSMYESLKLEFDLVFSEKERLSFENLELKNSLTDVQQKEAESLLKQQSYEVRIQQLEEGLQVSKSNMTTLEDSLESVNEQLSRSTEEKKHLLKEKANLTAQLAELLENKKVQETTVEADKVPFVEKIEQEFQGPLHQVKIEREAVQRSAAGPAAGPTEGVEELEHMKELYEKLSDEHTRLKNKQQVAEVKCEKMLIKLKAFKEKNENLLRELSELKDSQNKSTEGIALQNVDLEAEKQKHQETQNLLLAEQANVAKERAKIAKMETVFRNKFQEVLNEKNHLGDSCNQLKTKCKELGARLKELLAERQDLQNSIDHLTRESETVLEGVRNEYAVEKSSLQSKISSLETECNNAYLDIEDFQKLVSKMKESHEALLGENQKLKNSAHQLESELVNSQSVEEKIGRLELEVQGLQEERKSLQDQVEVAREEALAKMKELQIARKKQGDAEGKTKLQEEQINQLKELNETLQNAKWALEADLQRSQHQAEHSEQERKTLIDEVTILRQATTDNEVLKGELALVESEAERKEQSVALFKHEVDTLNEQVQSLTSQCRDLESTRQAITVLKKENGSLTEDVIRLNAENAELKSAKEELGVVSDRYNNLLQDNTALAKQIEELLTKLQKQSQLEKDLSFAYEQQGHLEREQATFIQRIEELEEQSQQLTNQNTQLKQEMVQVNSALKQAQFENESLKSQLQVMQSGGDRLSRFQEEYEKLQQQFAQSVEQNNQVQAELNHSTHRLQLREARCQQLAMQVSQLAEDRSYLNIQMGNLSLALREKEKEASNLSSQCKTWYEKHCQLQQKITELETSRAEALKSYNSQNEIEALNEKIHGLKAHQEELTKLNLEQTSQFTSEREQRLLAETNLIQLQEQIKILQQQQLQSAQDFQIQIDEDQDRVLEAQPLLSRHGSSFIHRLQRWVMVKNRQLSRLMRLQPRARTLIRIYFLLLHVAIVAFLMGLL